MRRVYYTIYTLSDPISKEIRYVGITTQPIQNRLYSHLSCRYNAKKYKWICNLKKRKLRPIIEELDYVVASKSKREENFWIEQFRGMGFNLLNGKFNLNNQRVYIK